MNVSVGDGVTVFVAVGVAVFVAVGLGVKVSVGTGVEVAVGGTRVALGLGARAWQAEIASTKIPIDMAFVNFEFAFT